MSGLASLSAAVLVALGAGPQDPPTVPPTLPVTVPQDPDGEADLGTIVVRGQQRSVEDRATDFVEQVAVAPRGRGLARWDQSICVGAANMNPRFAQPLIDRVSTIAADLGLEIGEPGCRANVIIAAAADADALATALVRDDPDGYRPAGGQTDLGKSALEAFQASDAPVRWWHVSLPVSVDTGEIAVRLNNQAAQDMAVRDASRLRANVRDDLGRVLIILDTTQLNAVPLRALADYVSLIALAQIDPEADTSRWSSVLNLFDADDAPDALTDWDRDYLVSLYDAPRDRARSSQQQRAIVRGMVDEAQD